MRFLIEYEFETGEKGEAFAHQLTSALVIRQSLINANPYIKVVVTDMEEDHELVQTTTPE